jgi:hypothetical protein
VDKFKSDQASLFAFDGVKMVNNQLTVPNRKRVKKKKVSEEQRISI